MAQYYKKQIYTLKMECCVPENQENCITSII